MASARHGIFPILVGSILAFFALAPSARATTIQLSSFSSELDPGPAVLDATLDFSVAGSQLTLTLRNDTTAPDEYLLNGVWWNGAAQVTALGLVSATHSKAGDVTAAWTPVETSAHVAGFGNFDFGLTVPSNLKNGNLLEAGENIVFVFTIAGTGPYTAGDFASANDQGKIAAAKFVSGPGDRSAFGSTDGGGPLPVPEPTTAAMLGLGLLGFALAGRRRS
jgi:hypothetical protein